MSITEPKRINEEFDQLIEKRIAGRFIGPTPEMFPYVAWVYYGLSC